MRLRSILFLLALLLPIAAPAAAQDDEAEFAALLARFQAGDTTVDAGALRMAYTRTRAYAPYDNEDAEEHGAMWTHLRAGRFEEAARTAEALLARNWLDVTPHMVAALAYAELGADSAAELHAFAVRALVGSIGSEDDGRSPEAPLRVIEISEQYAWLSFYGVRAERQGLGPCGDSRCDTYRVQEKGRESFIYFDVGIPYEWMQRQMRERSGSGERAPRD